MRGRGQITDTTIKWIIYIFITAAAVFGLLKIFGIM
jgi:hypothetical protein